MRGRRLTPDTASASVDTNSFTSAARKQMMQSRHDLNITGAEHGRRSTGDFDKSPLSKKTELGNTLGTYQC